MSLDDANAVTVRVHAPTRPPRGSLLVIHGLGGSAEAVYVRRTAGAALARGWSVVRMNLRTCGGSEAISRTLYNAGQWDDAGSVLAEMERRALPRPFVAAGFSLGGNLLLGHVGRAAGDCLADAAAGVNPPLDLSACIRSLEHPANAPFQVYFTLSLCAHLRRVRRIRKTVGSPAWPWSIGGVRGFDERFTAPDAGYAGAEAYYRGASAGPVLRAARIPVLVLTSRNDPFVPPESVSRWDRADRTRFVLVPEGGHVGYWQRAAPRFWAAEAMIDWFESQLGCGPRQRVS